MSRKKFLSDIEIDGSLITGGLSASGDIDFIISNPDWTLTQDVIYLENTSVVPEGATTSDICRPFYNKLNWQVDGTYNTAVYTNTKFMDNTSSGYNHWVIGDINRVWTNNPENQLTGTVSISEGSTTVDGSGTTSFDTELSSGNWILIGGEHFEVDSITDSDTLTVKTAAESTHSSVNLYKSAEIGNYKCTQYVNPRFNEVDTNPIVVAAAYSRINQFDQNNPNAKFLGNIALDYIQLKSPNGGTYEDIKYSYYNLHRVAYEKSKITGNVDFLFLDGSDSDSSTLTFNHLDGEFHAIKSDIQAKSRFKGEFEIRRGYTKKLSGKISVDGSTVNVTGDADTLFLTELSIGDKISINSDIYEIATITDDQNLTVTSATTDAKSDINYYTLSDNILTLSEQDGTERFSLSGNGVISLSSDGSTSAQINSSNLTASRTYSLPDASGTVALSESSEWYKATGTVSGGDLIVTMGDFDGLYTGTKLTIDIDEEQITVNAGNGLATPAFYITDSGYNARIRSYQNTSDRTYTLPDVSGTIALKDVDNNFSAGQTITGGLNVSSNNSYIKIEDQSGEYGYIEFKSKDELNQFNGDVLFSMNAEEGMLLSSAYLSIFSTGNDYGIQLYPDTEIILLEIGDIEGDGISVLRWDDDNILHIGDSSNPLIEIAGEYQTMKVKSDSNSTFLAEFNMSNNNYYFKVGDINGEDLGNHLSVTSSAMKYGDIDSADSERHLNFSVDGIGVVNSNTELEYSRFSEDYIYYRDMASSKTMFIRRPSSISTTNKTIYYPDASGTIALKDVDNNFSASQTITGTDEFLLNLTRTGSLGVGIRFTDDNGFSDLKYTEGTGFLLDDESRVNGRLSVDGDIKLNGLSGDYISRDGSVGYTGTHAINNFFTFVIKNGIITDVQITVP